MSGKRNPTFRKMKRTRTRPPRRGAARKAANQAGRAPTYQDLVQIVDLIRSASRFSEFRLRSGDIEIEFRSANGATPPAPHRAPPAHLGEPVGGEVSLELVPAALQVPSARSYAENLPPGVVLVRSPMIGTLYRVSEPGAPSFVEPGTRVAADTVVGIVEVMKLMNAVAAGCAGVVTHVLVENAGSVEYGQPLIAIDPAA